MSNVTYINKELNEIVSQLPRSYATRWSAARKAAVVNAVHAGILTLGKAMERYRLSKAEYESWEQKFASRGVQGLKVGQLAAQR